MTVKRINPLDYRRAAAKAYLTSGESYGAIAKEFNVDPTTVRCWVRQFREEFAEVTVERGHSPEYRRNVAMAYLTGKTLAEIGREFNISATTARSWVRQYKSEFAGVVGKKTHSPEHRRKVAEAYLTSDRSLLEIGRQFNIHEATVCRWAQRYKGECAGDIVMKPVIHTPEYRRKVGEAYLASGKSAETIGREFNVGRTTVARWTQELKEDFSGEVSCVDGISTFNSSNNVDPAMKQQKLSPEQMEQRIRELESRLEHERMHRIVLDQMIELAERDLKISIRKKSGAKQSR